LSIIGQTHLESVQRSRSRTFKIVATRVKTAAVARALEFVLSAQPVWSAPKVRAFGVEAEKLSALLANDPDSAFGFVPSADCPHNVLRWSADSETGWWFEQYSGEEEPEGSQGICGQEYYHTYPSQTSQHFSSGFNPSQEYI
jgi:hypothetical protein